MSIEDASQSRRGLTLNVTGPCLAPTTMTTAVEDSVNLQGTFLEILQACDGSIRVVRKGRPPTSPTSNPGKPYAKAAFRRSFFLSKLAATLSKAEVDLLIFLMLYTIMPCAVVVSKYPP